MNKNVKVGALQIYQNCPTLWAKIWKYDLECFHPKVLSQNEHIDIQSSKITLNSPVFLGIVKIGDRQSKGKSSSSTIAF